MTKLQRFRKINKENKNLTTKKLKLYIDSHYAKNPPKAENLSPLTFVNDTEFREVIRLMKKTSKLLLTKDYIWDYMRTRNRGYGSMSEESIRNYNEQQYIEKTQNRLIEQVLECNNDDSKKEEKLISKLNGNSIRILKERMGYKKVSYPNGLKSGRNTSGYKRTNQYYRY